MEIKFDRYSAFSFDTRPLTTRGLGAHGRMAPPPTFFAKCAVQNCLVIILVFFKNLCSFTCEKISLDPFDSTPVLFISEILCQELTNFII